MTANLFLYTLSQESYTFVTDSTDRNSSVNGLPSGSRMNFIVGLRSKPLRSVLPNLFQVATPFFLTILVGHTEILR